MQETHTGTSNKSGFAAIIGVSPGRVSQMIGDGLPVEISGQIDIEKGKAWVRENVDPSRRRSQPDKPLPRNTSKATRDAAEAEIAQLKAAQLGGKLIDSATTLRTIESRARFERDAWIGWVNRAAPEIASAANADLSAVIIVLDRLVRDQLGALAATPLELDIP